MACRTARAVTTGSLRLGGATGFVAGAAVPGGKKGGALAWDERDADGSTMPILWRREANSGLGMSGEGEGWSAAAAAADVSGLTVVAVGILVGYFRAADAAAAAVADLEDDEPMLVVFRLEMRARAGFDEAHCTYYICM